VMQVNFEDSSTVPTGGWKGLINDPKLDGSLQINKGVREARQLLLDINRLGLPAGCEYLDTITPQFIADLISWAHIGARTCASRSHRELASGLSTPVGFQKGLPDLWHDDRVAVDAVRASAAPHAFLSVSKQGVAGIVETTGNRDCHVVLPADNLEGSLETECGALRGLELPTKVVVHCCVAPSTGASAVDVRAAEMQMAAVRQVAEMVGRGNDKILGVLLPSFLLSGRQDLHAKPERRAYGMSVTEPCMDWTATTESLKSLAASVRQRRKAATAKRMRL